MEKLKDHLQDISAIRSLMDEQSKFLSLSGLSGVSVGITAVAGCAIFSFFSGNFEGRTDDFNLFVLLLSASILLVSVSLSLFFSLRMAEKRNLPTWNKGAQRMIIHLALPLMAGGLFCLIQFLQGHVQWIPATTLMFYGMALLSAAKYTIREIRLLGIIEIALGLACAMWFEFSLWFWGFGFGIMHILYGIVIYQKYER